MKTKEIWIGFACLTLGLAILPQASAQFTPIRGTFNGLMFENNGLWEQSSGFISIQTTPRGTYTGVLRVGVGRYPFSGRFDQNGYATRDILRYRQYPLALHFQSDPADPDLITGTVSDGIWTADLIADRLVFDGKASVSPDAGRYTLLFPGNFAASDAPGGDSFGTITINKSGQLAFYGSMADGRKFTQSSTVSKGGQWPLYAPLYGGEGSIYSWMLFNDPSGEDVSGDVTWIRPAVSSAWYYPGGFAINVYSWGSRYTPPPASTPLINLSAGQIEFNGGNLIRGITNSFSLDARNRVTNYSANGLRLKFLTSNGSFSGEVKDPITWQWTPFRGVVLQRYALGAGYFLGWDESGEVWIQAD